MQKEVARRVLAYLDKTQPLKKPRFGIFPAPAPKKPATWQLNVRRYFNAQHNQLPPANFRRYMNKERKKLEPLLELWGVARSAGDKTTERSLSRRISQQISDTMSSETGSMIIKDVEVEAPIIQHVQTTFSEENLQKLYKGTLPDSKRTWEALAGKSWHKLSDRDKYLFALKVSIFKEGMKHAALQSWLSNLPDLDKKIALLKQAVEENDDEWVSDMMGDLRNRFYERGRPGIPQQWKR